MSPKCIFVLFFFAIFSTLTFPSVASIIPSRKSPFIEECKLRSVCFALDQSLFIDEDEYAKIQKFAVIAATKLSNFAEDVLYSAVAFSSSAVLLQKSTSNLNAFISAVNSPRQFNGGQNIESAKSVCNDELEKTPSGGKAIFVVTDGADGMIERRSADKVNPTVEITENNVVVITVRVRRDFDKRLRKKIATKLASFIRTSLSDRSGIVNLAILKLCTAVSNLVLVPSPTESVEPLTPSPSVSVEVSTPSPTVIVDPVTPSPNVSDGFMKPSPTVSVDPMTPSPNVSDGFMTPSPAITDDASLPSPSVTAVQVSPMPSVTDDTITPSPAFTVEPIKPSSIVPSPTFTVEPTTPSPIVEISPGTPLPITDGPISPSPSVPGTIEDCESAFAECEFTFENRPSLPTFSIDGQPDKSFTPRIVSKDSSILLGILNTNIEPEFLNSNVFDPISSRGFASTAFKPFTLGKGSGIGRQALGSLFTEAKGLCLRIFFSNIQTVDTNGRAIGNLNNVPKSSNQCVVFRTM